MLASGIVKGGKAEIAQAAVVFSRSQSAKLSSVISPAARASMVASQHGVELTTRARQLTPEDMQRFDVVIAMDHENLRNIERMADAAGSEARIKLLRAYDSDSAGEEVPDPYYGGASGFENVYEMLHRSCQVLLEELRAA